MKREKTGRYITITTLGAPRQAFIPNSLPPEPSIDWTPDLQGRFEEAHLALGRLDGITRSLHASPSHFLALHVRKEAIVSSMIEGTQSSLSDLLLFEQDEIPSTPLDDVKEVVNYVAALEMGMTLLTQGLPISLRFIREVHAVLLRKGRGSKQSPGEFRRIPVWLGSRNQNDVQFIPPPPNEMLRALHAWELFINNAHTSTPPLLKNALAHVQFETIHPFLDGNGRLGRLLIVLMLANDKLLHKPLLYISLYFKTHRQEYYTLLNSVREEGDWESWLLFYAEAMIATAEMATDSISRLMELEAEDQDRIATLGRRADSARQIHQLMNQHPIVTSRTLSKESDLSPATIYKALENLISLGIVEEVTGHRRNRVFQYSRLIELMNQGTELPDT